jgi:hypothetical protein
MVEPFVKQVQLRPGRRGRATTPKVARLTGALLASRERLLEQLFAD